MTATPTQIHDAMGDALQHANDQCALLLKENTALQVALRKMQILLCPEFETCDRALPEGAACACGFIDGPHGNAVPLNRAAGERDQAVLDLASEARNSLAMNDELEKMTAEREMMLARASEIIAAQREALVEINKGRGEFSRNPLTHAINTIEEMKAIARAALALKLDEKKP